MEATYWLVGVKFKFVNVKGQEQKDERAWTVWADNVDEAEDECDYQWESRMPKTFIRGTEKFLKPRKLKVQEIKKLESVFKK